MARSVKNLLVFDIETIPDSNAAKNLVDTTLSDLVLQRKALTDYHMEITDGKNDFLRQPFHKVVAISMLHCSVSYEVDNKAIYTLKSVKSGGNLSSSEADLVKGFFDTIDKLKPQIISFNGRTFDIPVLKYRAMKYGITCDYFYNSGTNYESYNHRYAKAWHLDLLDVLSDYGSSARIKLNEVCSIFGLPGKFGVSGANVTEMYDNGKLEEIRNYCETDVLNTYLVYLFYALHTYTISQQSFNISIENVLSYIDNSSALHLKEFKEAWKLSSDNKFAVFNH